MFLFELPSLAPPSVRLCLLAVEPFGVQVDGWIALLLRNVVGEGMAYHGERSDWLGSMEALRDGGEKGVHKYCSAKWWARRFADPLAALPASTWTRGVHGSGGYTRHYP